jgi:OOP family OmpA-OmpF porin
MSINRTKPIVSGYPIKEIAFKIALFIMVSCVSIAGYAEPYREKAGSKDYPLVSRFQGSILYNYGVLNSAQVEVPIGEDEVKVVTGKVFNYFYFAPKDHTDLEIFRDYKISLEREKFTIVLACEDALQCARQSLGKHASEWTQKPTTFFGGYNALSFMDENGNSPPRVLTARLRRSEGDIFVVLTTREPSSREQNSGVGAPYFVQVIETSTNETSHDAIKVEALNTAIASEGKIAVYGIYFDTGKANIKPYSTPQLNEIAKLLAQHLTSKYFIVGHTDNQGRLDRNLALSQKRASAVASALIKTYKVDPRRLIAKGVANYAPVASNMTEAGRAKNRRVEIVAQ